MVTTCLRESSDLSYDPKFQRALQDLRASAPPWDSPGADRVRDALRKTRRIRSIRERGTKTVLACCDGQAGIYLVDVLGSGKHSGSHVVLPPLLVPRFRPSLVVEGESLSFLIKIINQGPLSLTKDYCWCYGQQGTDFLVHLIVLCL